ncbi:CLUMA_CG006304, isoform A [Clunio marinus]|uniref:CLUMA_CG006304, isoform A n=1 Tax=Clunio marinus TaxID=568069 RepID=A0A1J1I3F5_9DIPT|nr:CLUMA_CG006304, isoform A [Clunio marinus]
MSTTDKILYPNQLKPVTEDLRDDELIRRLKALSLTLQAMGQDDENFSRYTPLAVHLVKDFFLSHDSKDVQLLVACCIADILRVFAPEAPYKEPDQIKEIFEFLIRQLNGLKDPKDPAFKRYFYLLENLAYVKSFNMCFELVESQEIFCSLFSLIFKIVNDEHSEKVKSFMQEILVPLLSESDSISNELLDIIFINIIEPNKTQRKNAYNLAKDLIKKTTDSLTMYVQAFLNEALMQDKPDKSYQSSKRIYDLIYELNVIAPSLLLSVLPQLECKIKSSNEGERLKAVALLARMFSEKDSKLGKQHTVLLNHFLGRFLDIAVAIRIKCVQSTMHFLVNHTNLRPEIINVLNGRQHDSDESVRYEVVNSIVETARRDYIIVAESPELLAILKERSQDKKFKIRRAALNGLAYIYNKHLQAVQASEATIESPLDTANWIQIKILNGYYHATLEDQLLIERLLITNLVPYTLPASEKMKALYKLFATIDDHAMKAFVELQKNQMKMRKTVMDWIKLHKIKETPETQKEVTKKMNMLMKLFPDPLKSQEYLVKFSAHLRKDKMILMDMETILRRDVDNKACTEAMTSILKKLGTPIMTNIYYNTVKILLSRIASVMIDREAHFLHDSVLRPMMALLSFELNFVAASIFKALTHLGRFKSLIDSHPEVLEDLAPICKHFAFNGTPKQAKHAIRCLFVNSNSNSITNADKDNESVEETNRKRIKKQIDHIFQEIVDATNQNLNVSSEHYRTAIVSFGHIAYNLPERFNIPLKNIVSRKIVKDLLIGDLPDVRQHKAVGDWCDEEQLSEEIRCRVEGLKAIARWLVGMKDNVVAAQKTFRMLCAFINKAGDILDKGQLSEAEKAWLRVAAGNAMLKICEQKGVGDEYNAEQFLTLSTLMVKKKFDDNFSSNLAFFQNDPVLQVRELFLKKLHKGLYKGIPHKCLPLDFMGIYSMCGRETDKKLGEQMKSNYEVDVNHRREYVKTFSNGGIEGALGQLANILPDYILPFAVTVLSHSNLLEDRTNIDELKIAEKCLSFILEPLINNKDTFCFSLYKNMIEKMKNAKSAYQPHNDTINEKLWTLCDLSLHLILTKLKNVDTREYSLDQVNIPRMYFQEQDTNFKNEHNYLSLEFKSLLTATSTNDSGNATVNAGPAPKRSGEIVVAYDQSKRLRNA